MYDVRIYRNTGLNAVNIVDSPALLNDSWQFDFDSVQALDILQNIHLATIKVKSTWQNIKDVDYCRIGNAQDGYFYYFVDGVRMCAVDVAELNLIPDFITSAGGIDNVEILDGIVTRCHVSSDTYGAWNIEDEFLTPSEPLLLDTEQINFGGASTVYVESSLDLGVMSAVGASDAYIDSEGESVQVPKSYTCNVKTSYTMGGNAGSETETTITPVNDIIRNGINRCRALGIESAVRSQFVLPNSLVSATTVNEFVRYVEETQNVVIYRVEEGQPTPDSYIVPNASFLYDPQKQRQINFTVVSNLSSAFVDSATSLQYEYQNVNNKRVLYGSLNRIGILTTAGNRLESNPEDTRSGDTYITIRSVGDPHPTGAPYHRFKTMNGNSSVDAFFLNAVKGLQWKQIPLMYSEPSGNVLNAINFQNSRDMQDLQFMTTPTGLARTTLEGLGASRETASAITQIGSMVGGMLSGMGVGNLAGGGNGAMVIAGGVTGALGAGLNTGRTMANYDLTRKQEMQQFAIQQRVSSPEISVSYDGEAFRDFYGETVVVYRYRPTPTDINRLDTILTMYGYKVNIAGKDAPTHNRQYFNYLMGNLTVGGNMPKWLADGITMQVANGVRIWHVKPSSNYYNNNPIV